ncbi:MAG: hypothetical protein ACP5HK_01735 [Acidilobus sp.]
MKSWERLFPNGLPHLEPVDEPVFATLDLVAEKGPSRCVAFQLETGACYTWAALMSI